jgi:hypothetical protein
MGLIKFDEMSAITIADKTLENLNSKKHKNEKFTIHYKSPYGSKFNKKIIVLLNNAKILSGATKNAIAYVEKNGLYMFSFELTRIYLTVNMSNLNNEIVSWEKLLKIGGLANEIIKNTIFHEMMHVEQYAHVHKITNRRIYCNTDFILKKVPDLYKNKYMFKRSEFDPMIKTMVCDMLISFNTQRMDKKSFFSTILKIYLETSDSDTNLLKSLKKYDTILYKKALKKIYLEFIG